MMGKYIKLEPEKLRAFRRERGLSQEAASWECQNLSLHISEATIKRAESGKAILYRTASDFAQLFNVPLAELTQNETALSDTSESILLTDETTSKVLLGRNFEVRQFEDIIDTCRKHTEGRLLCVRGIAGIGKSRLLAEFKRIAQASKLDFHQVQVKQTQGSGTHSAIAELLHQLLEFSPTTVDETQLITGDKRFSLSQTEQLHLSNLLGMGTPAFLKKLDESINFTRRVNDEHQLLFKVISTLYREQPCVIAFDDMQWVDEALLLSLRHLSSSIRELPIILILSTRLENDPIDAVWRSCVINTPTTTMDLSPLTDKESEILAHNYKAVEPDYVQQAIHLSEGNPLFLEQLLMNYPCKVGCFPNDLRDLIALRLQTLPEQSQTLVKAASIIGSKVDLTLLDFLMDNIDYDLNGLINHLFIRPVDADNIEFCHELIRQGIYENLNPQEKISFHAIAANWYLGKDKRLYAKHLSLSKSYKAPTAFLHAAEEQAEKHNYGAALSMVDKALSIAGSKADLHRLFLSKGLILKQLDLPEKSLNSFSDAVDYAENDQQRCESYLEMTFIYHFLQRREDALRALTAAGENITDDLQARYSYLQQQIKVEHVYSFSPEVGLFDTETALSSSQRIAKVIQETTEEQDDFLGFNTKQFSQLSVTKKKTLKVGILHSQSGNLRELEEGVIRTTLMAIGEINQNGGLLSHTIEPVLVDGKSSESGFYLGAQQLTNNPEINTIFGCSTSSSRRVVKPLIESANHILVYPFQYEGIEQSEHIFYVGPAPNQTALPAIEWLFHKQHRNYFLLGSDYVYPVVTNLLIKEQLSTWQLNLQGESYVPLGCTRFSKIIEQIKATQPDVVVLTLVGLESNREFFRQYHQSGLAQSKITLLSLVLSENDLIDIPTETVAGTYTLFSYFQNFDSPINEQFVRRYKQCFGAAKQVGGYMESAYVGVYLWAKAVQQANSLDREKIRLALKGIAHFGPGGIAYVDEDNGHVWRQVQVARVGDDGEFVPLWRSEKPIKPEPFPKGSSPSEWFQRLEKLRQDRWQGNWEQVCSAKSCVFKQH